MFYDSVRDKQGQAAAKAAAELKPVDTVTLVEKRFDGLLDLELDAASKRFALIRELEIRELAFKNDPIKDTLLKRIEDRLTRTTGMTDWKHIKSLNNSYQKDRKVLEEALGTFRDTFSIAPECSEVKKEDEIPERIVRKIREENREEAKGLIRRIFTSCVQMKKSQEELDEARRPTEGTLLFSAFRQLESDRKEQKQNEYKKKETEEELKKAKEAYAKEAGKQEKEDDTTYKARTADAAKKLQDALKNLEKGEHAVGIEVLARERLDRIRDIISAVAGGNVDTSGWDADLRMSAVVAGSLPALADEADKMLRDAQRPRLTPLVIAREHQQKLVEESERVEKIMAGRVTASEKIVEAYRNEIDTLSGIYITLNKEKQKPWHAKSLLKLAKESSSEEKRLLFELLGVYFDDVSRFQSEQQFWEYRRVATLYDESIVRSKYAAMMWQNLLEGTANTLAAYHGSGIKPEDLARLVQAAGVVGIGVGVNR